MAMRARETVKFDAIKIALNKSWTPRTRSKRRGQWGMRVTRANVRRRNHPNYISHSTSNKSIKWGIRGKSENTFRPVEYRSAENYLRARASAKRPYAIAIPSHLRENIISDHYVQGKLVIRESSRDKFKSEPNKILYYILETIKETFKIQKEKENPGLVWNIEGIIAILVFITFLFTCLLQAIGRAAEVPVALVRVVDLIVGYFFGKGSAKVRPLE